MVKALFDTTILIDFLRGIPMAKIELGLYSEQAVSLISWMDVMAGAQPSDEAQIEQFLSGVDLVPVTDQVARRAVQLRRNTRITLPDAIIWATAQIDGMLFVTGNTRDFPVGDPSIRLPYEIQ